MNGTATLRLDNDRLFLIGLAFAIAPIWLATYPPLVDMPQHAGQIAALQRLLADDPRFTALFQVNWFTPYLLGYLLLYGLATVLPMLVAAKLLLSAAVVALPLATRALLRNAGGDPELAWLAIPASFSFAFYWGFLSYLVAVPIGLLFVIAAVRYARRPGLPAAAGIALFSLFLFFCHVLVLLIASALALSVLAGEHHRAPRRLVTLSLPFAAPLPLIWLWSRITHEQEAQVQSAPVVYGDFVERLLGFAIQPSGLDGVLLPLSIVITAVIVAYPLVNGMRLTRQPARWLPLLAALALYFGAPSFAQGTGFLYHRTGVFLVPMWLLVWDRNPGGVRRLQWLPLALVAIWASINIVRFTVYDRETRAFSRVVAEMAPAGNAVYMVFQRGSSHFRAPMYLHFGAWYQALHQGIVDFNFAYFHPQMVRYRPGRQSPIGEQFAWSPQLFDWTAHGGASYDYFLIHAPLDASQYVFKDAADAVELVAQDGRWWLYRPRTAPAGP